MNKNSVVDPVMGVMYHCRNKKCSIADMNQKCYSICAAYNQNGNPSPSFVAPRTDVSPYPVAPQIPDSWSVTPECANRCEEMLNKQKILQFGVNSCDHQAPYRPVVWGETPHYFPLLYKESGNKEIALEMCQNLCSEHPLAEQCRDNCMDEYKSLVSPAVVPSASAGGGEDASPPISIYVILGVLAVVLIVLAIIKKYRK